MWIAELLMTNLSLDWLRRILASAGERFEEVLDIAHFALIVNRAILVVAFFMIPTAFDLLDPIHGPVLKSFAFHVLAVSIPVWCAIFGVWRWKAVRGRRRIVVQYEPADLSDEWLDGPA